MIDSINKEVSTNMAGRMGLRQLLLHFTRERGYSQYKLRDVVQKNKEKLYYVAASMGAGITLMIFSDKLQKFGAKRDMGLVRANQQYKPVS